MRCGARAWSGSGRGPGAVALTEDQKAAFALIESRLAPGEAAPGEARPLLLHGVTGSGKTEVYLRSVAAALERGHSAVVLVPEIALTPQTAGRFVERFGDQVAVMHSRLSQRERYDEWWRMRRGEARVCVGPRSAVFAPFDDLGLIIVDEEHDGSYKQEGDPRYDARTVAERRAAEEGALLVVGSATPRPESMLRHERIVLSSRVDGRRLPPVELVGMAGTAGPLHERTRQALDEVRRREEKAIVLLNRRGWSNFLSCRSCGRVWECPNCDVTLVLHRALDEMACHHCGHREVAPRVCPDCESVSVARHGAGTEQLERELEELVAPLPVFRLDSDVAAAAGVATVLRRFDEAPAGILVGTQMVAKGHDFPDVTLGVVLDADATLRFPDFRSEERTFALVAQLAGRSGRGERGGHVIVQALDPSAESLRFAARHDSEGFLAAELRRRELLSYPPHGHLIRVVCASVEPGPELAAATAIRELTTAAGVPALGPAPLFRRQGRHRAQLLVRSPERAAGDHGRARGGGAGGRRARARRGELRRRRRSAVARAPAARRQSTLRSRSLALDSASMAEERQSTEEEPAEVAEPLVEAPDSTDEDAPPLDPEAEARRVAAMSFIRRLGDPILKSSATPVDRFDDSLRRQVSRMAGIMGDAYGVGLAAPQLGLSQRLLVYRVGPDAPVVALANPELEWSSDDQETLDEGCLSIPGITVDVERPVYVRVRALDEEGETRMVEASGLEARVIQHEMDHLNGVLILDRTTRDERKRALRELRDAERAKERDQAA